LPSSLASRYFSPDPISLLKAWASRLRRDALQSPRQTSIQHPLQIWAQRVRLREQDWRDALGSTEAAALNFVQTIELFNMGVLKTCWQVCRSLHIQGQARLRIGASAIEIIPGQIKRAARDSQAACGSFIGGSWIASDLSSVLTPVPHELGIHGALERGFAASSFEDFFSRFGVFFSFISGSLPQATHRL